ncbi:hypothetical protein K2173_002406 [Erythroxylum novogranatense]|uniref:DUF7086 domain-containing protein n=1 Tax=Erythroxylum novogranatense TaxID=1862640 RepID=A0AAV8TBG8_9ROSI|nr:hypothetical protein K2173_002406 [Erythroxylum novogranatense]
MLHFGKRRRDININNNEDNEDGNLALCLSSSYNRSSSNIANTTSRNNKNNKTTSLDIQLSLSLPTLIPPPQDIIGQQPDRHHLQQQTLISPPQRITSQQPVHHHRHQTLIPPPQDSTQREVQDHGILIPPPQETSQQQVLFHHDHGTLIPPPQDINTQQPVYHHHGTLIQPPNQVVMVPSAFTVQSPISHHTPFGYCTTPTANSDNSMNHHQQEAPRSRGSLLRAPRVRRNKPKSRREGTTESVPVLYPWATDKRATVHSLEYLRSKQIRTISGLVQCKKCDRQFEIEYNLEEKFAEMGSFIAQYKNTMHDRAPSAWLNPVLPQCTYCNLENAARPVITDKKAINWLFLLLGQMLGCCTLEQLKYFCKYTKNHRTGAKDRVLYLTYLGLCKQLDPDGPFDR